MERHDGPVLWMVGIVLVGLAVAMIPSILIGMVYNEDLIPFIVPFAIYSVVGLSLLAWFRMGYVRPANVMVMVAAIWIVSIGFGTAPLRMSGMEWIDALLESASGYTTAGCSIIQDFSDYSNALLFYRCVSNWVGGIMIILIVMIILPMAGVGSRSIIGNEMSGSESSGVSIRIRDAAIQFSFIYIVMTVAMILLLIVGGVDPFDALELSLCTVSAGGMISGDIVITTFIKIVMIVFMFLTGTNYYLHFKALFLHKPSVYRHNSEFMGVLIWSAFLSIGMFLIVNQDGISEPVVPYLDVLFTIISSVTTSGYTLPSMVLWPSITVIIPFAIAFIGASSGSTSGGIKVSRVIVLVKYAKSSMNRLLHPNSVYEVYVDGSPVSKGYVRNSLTIIMMFMTTVCFFTAVFMLCGVDFNESIMVVLAMITSFGTVDVHIGLMSPFLKFLMVIMMWLGRLEVIVALAIISPRVWKEHFKDILRRREKARA